MPQTNLSNIQEQDVSVRFTNAIGNPAPINGVPVWVSDNTEILQVFPSEDGMSAVIRTVGLVGNCNVTVTANASFGETPFPISGNFQVSVNESGAVNVEFTLGDVRTRS